MDPLNPDYWHDRWANGRIGWHQKAVEPALIRHFSKKPPTQVLVPLCGKSLDLVWLRDQGHDVIGVELSPLACTQFFDELRLEPAISKRGPFHFYSSPRLSLLQGDFFDLEPSETPSLGAVYDRGALIALPPPLRLRYAQQITRLLRGSSSALTGGILQIAIDGLPANYASPPFPVSEQELRALYRQNFSVTCLARETLALDAEDSPSIQESVYELTLLSHSIDELASTRTETRFSSPKSS